MEKKLKKIPKFKSEEDERKFWAEVDSSEYIDWSKDNFKGKDRGGTEETCIILCF